MRFPFLLKMFAGVWVLEGRKKVMIAVGSLVMLIGILVGIVIGFVFGSKFTYRLLEHEGRLKPETPPTVARR